MTAATQSVAKTTSPGHKEEIKNIVCNLGDVTDVVKGLRASMDYSDLKREEQRSEQAILTLAMRALAREADDLVKLISANENLRLSRRLAWTTRCAPGDNEEGILVDGRA